MPQRRLPPDGAAARPTARRVTALSVALLAGLVVAGCASEAPAATLAVAPGGADGNPCTEEAPCRSLSRAYSVSSPGDVVTIAPGNYGDQTIGWDAGMTEPGVEFRAAPGANPTFGSLDVNGSYVTVTGPLRATGLSVFGTDAARTVRGVLVRNAVVDRQEATGTATYVNSVDGVTFSDVVIGNNQEASLVLSDGGYRSGVRNLTFDNVTFHDAWTAPGSSTHTECYFAGGGSQIVVRNSLFFNCRVMDMFVTEAGGAQPSGFTLENNVFEHSVFPDGRSHYFSFVWRDGSPVNDLLMRNNTFETTVDWPSDATSLAGGSVAGNVFLDGAACKSGVTFSRNVTTGGPCAASDLKVSPAALAAGFQHPGAHDWRLRAGAPPIGRGDPANTPATDRAGVPRGSIPDAGAYQYAPSTLAGGDPGSGDAGAGGGASSDGPGGSTTAQHTIAGRRAAPRLSRPRLSRHRICAVQRVSCRATRTRLSFHLSRAATVKVSLVRVGDVGTDRTVRSTTVHGRPGTTVMTITSRRLKPGLYHVVVRRAAGGRPVLRLRLRVA